MGLLRYSIEFDDYPRGVASRPGQGGNGHETLVATRFGKFHILEGGERRGSLRLGEALRMYTVPERADTTPETFKPTSTFGEPVWDPFSSSIFFLDSHAIMRLSSDNVVTLVAGHRTKAGRKDGQGPSARFSCPRFPVSDGCGSLFIADNNGICRVKLPTVWRTGGSTEPNLKTFSLEAEVTTLLTVRGVVGGLAFIKENCPAGWNILGSYNLIYATETAIYRLPLGGTNRASTPVLLAGCEGNVRFSLISGLVAAGDGTILLVDSNRCYDEGSKLISMTLSNGAVSIIAPCLEDKPIWPSILPNGYVSLCKMYPASLLVLDLGIAPLGSRAPVACGVGANSSSGGCCLRRTLSSDLAALLDRQPDGTSDLTLIVSGRTFYVHRSILTARCDYFRLRLTSGFADGDTPVLSLPDVDPDAFAALLRFLYTGSPSDVPSLSQPPALQRQLAELADRLLLPELCAIAQAQLLAAVTLDNLVDLLIWASERGEAFHDALARLTEWYLLHQAEVMEHKAEDVKRLMVTHPELASKINTAAAKLGLR
ncbi:hypothetical protein Vretimale_17139 [Volvox reticuliferus]|uniref:BTB domain-containing protein n=1 Tax=Volvox reticuliferus TaxID=1737510 RepID=A0A8J4GSJ8_9CHLO|nr:hypothetical protein Vretifemale_18606 [Volvox reticuliferus]GIM14121.1 hypothetical protein Vretimale_17139 [Volvox reticuliferus]